MTPKEKAEELFDKYYDIDDFGYSRGEDSFLYWSTEVLEKQAKQCALIAVDEILNSSPSLPILGDGGTYGEDIELSKLYWQEVKQEILAV